jgi:hypothetical protein
MGKLHWAFLCAAFSLSATASVAREMDLRMMLTLGDREVGKVANGKDVRKALAKCNPPKTCSYVGLNRDPQIDYAATYEKGGYTIEHRTGPPGPLFDGMRKGKGSRDHFSTREMIEITADYLDGRQTPFVRWKSSPLP